MADTATAVADPVPPTPYAILRAEIIGNDFVVVVRTPTGRVVQGVVGDWKSIEEAAVAAEVKA